MNLRLVRSRYSLYGVFGALLDELNRKIAITLEHAYPTMHGSFTAKIPPGDYVCVRGQHRLPGMTNTFETFEVTNVPGHTGILFHKGNYNSDSEGCILLGLLVATGCVLESRQAFADFLAVQEGCDSFTLTVE